MQDITRIGTVLIKEGTLLPDSLLLESEPYAPGWRVIKNLDSYGLDRQVSRERWTFFYQAGEIQASACGSYGPEKVRRAIQRILAVRGLEKFNSLEVTRVTRKRFLGIPYTAVTAHSRHIQESLFIFRTAEPLQWSPPIKLAA